MTQNITSNLALSIDFKHDRIRIHKSTLRAMGRPDYVQLLINPEERMLAVMRADRSDLSAHRLHWPRLASGQCFELHSKPFLKALFGLRGDWQDNRTYRIYGECLPDKGVAIFRVEDAVGV